MSRSNDDKKWLQFYQNNQPPTMQNSWSSGDGAATVVTAINTSGGVSNQLSRVTRPTTNTNNRSRRSRASRKTPTTLLNTDTTNFRAMVQQFTGGGGGGSGGGGGGGGGAPLLPSQYHSSSVTATHQSLNTYSTTTSSTMINDGVASSSYNSVGGLLSDHDGRSVEFRQPYFTVDDGGSSTGYGGDDDQNMGYGQRGCYNW